jgi:DNA helicase-2/ATP-dependent DNA helicase PcrA
MKRSIRDLLINLNDEQKKVVKHLNGPLLVIAVAGSGKTRALVSRIAYLIYAYGVIANKILAVTFSKKAADEMNDRLIEIGVSGCRIGTWHSLAWQILRTENVRYSDWTVDTNNRFRIIVKNVLSWKSMNWKTADISAVISYVSRCKASLAAPHSDKSMEIAEGYLNDSSMLNEAYYRVNIECEDQRLMTFDDMLVRCNRLLSDPDVAERWSNKWSYLLQDEAQDQNIAQSEIGKVLAGNHKNYMCVGDPNQSIYKFRGAVPERLIGFKGEWNSSFIKMHRNYRSASKIVDIANSVIKYMSDENTINIDMTCECDNDINEVYFRSHTDMDQEGSAVVDDMVHLNQDGVPWGEMACIYRVNAQSRGIEDVLLARGIPYIVYGGCNFYTRKEVKDLVSYLRVAFNFNCTQKDFSRCITTPFRYLGKVFLNVCCNNYKNSWPDAVRSAIKITGNSRQTRNALEWVDLIEIISKMDDVSDILDRVIAETNFINRLIDDEGDENVENSRVSNCKELVRISSKFTDVKTFLTYVDSLVDASKLASNGTDTNRVVLCSIHKSKGLEWPYVWLVGCNEKILPHGRATDIDEERRLYYVAVTRAMCSLTVSHVDVAALGSRIMELKPSRFIANEMAAQDV